MTPAEQKLPQAEDSQPHLTPQEIRRYDQVQTLIDWTPEQSHAPLQELRELQPAQSQQDLPAILRAVGERVAGFFEDFPNTISTEEVRSGPCGGAVLHKCGVTFKDKFNYLVVRRTEGGQIMGEYRTDAKGRPLDYRSLGNGDILTYGFTTVPLQHFHPLNQMTSRFRYFGRQMVGRQEMDVVGFVEIPGKYPRTTELRHGNVVVPLFVQGLAWIDPTTYQVLRIQTDLLAPPPNLGLERAVTRIEFSPVQLREASAFWLPTRVIVDMWLHHRHFRNIHRYSNFKVFVWRPASVRFWINELR